MSEGLLHLGAMAVLVGAVFLNLDKVSAVASDLSIRLDELKPFVRGGLKSLERSHKKTIETGEQMIDPVYDTFGAYFLLWFAEYDTSLYAKWKRIMHFFHRRFRAPFMRGFRRGWHRYPVGILTLISIAAFLLCVYAEVHGYEMKILNFTGAQTREFCYWLFTATILWTFATAYISHRLYTLQRICERYLNQTQRRNSASKAHGASGAVSAAYKAVVGPHAPPAPAVDDETKE